MSQEKDFLQAVVRGDAEGIASLLEASPSLAATRDHAGVSAPLLALYHRRSEQAEGLVAEKERVEPLDVFEAAAFGRTERLRALVAREPELVNAFASDGFSPLGLAAFFARESAASYLLDAGADPDLAARNPMKVRALHSATAARCLSIVRAVLEAGADVNAVQQGGFTALHAAAMAGQLEITELLLARGADPNAKADDGRTALDMAREAKHEAVVEILSGRARGTGRPG